MAQIIETMEEIIDYKGYKIKIRQDESPESPDSWGNTDIFLVYDHKQFDIERKGFVPKDIYQYLENNHEQLEDHTYDEYFCFVVYAYIHSGVALSLGDKSYPFDDKWDVSTTGFVLVRKDANEGWEIEEKAREAAEDLIKEWNMLLSGEVYGYIVYKLISRIDNLNDKITTKLLEDYYSSITNIASIIKDVTDLIKEEFKKETEEEEIDSCWGFYGKEFCIEEAKSIIDYEEI